MTLTEEERKEAIEHRDAIMNVRALLSTAFGKSFIKYLFKNLDVGELPEIGMEGAFLSDRLGSLRAGKSIFELVSEANPTAAGEILAEVIKEKIHATYRREEVSQ